MSTYRNQQQLLRSIALRWVRPQYFYYDTYEQYDGMIPPREIIENKLTEITDAKLSSQGSSRITFTTETKTNYYLIVPKINIFKSRKL